MKPLSYLLYWIYAAIAFFYTFILLFYSEKLVEIQLLYAVLTNGADLLLLILWIFLVLYFRSLCKRYLTLDFNRISQFFIAGYILVTLLVMSLRALYINEHWRLIFSVILLIFFMIFSIIELIFSVIIHKKVTAKIVLSIKDREPLTLLEHRGVLFLRLIGWLMGANALLSMTLLFSFLSPFFMAVIVALMGGLDASIQRTLKEAKQPLR